MKFDNFLINLYGVQINIKLYLKLGIHEIYSFLLNKNNINK